MEAFRIQLKLAYWRLVIHLCAMDADALAKVKQDQMTDVTTPSKPKTGKGTGTLTKSSKKQPKPRPFSKMSLMELAAAMPVEDKVVQSCFKRTLSKREISHGWW